MRKPLKIGFTAALALFQLGQDVFVLLAAVKFVCELLGDNNDGTFTPSCQRAMKAANLFGCVLAVWLFWLFLIIWALIGMWGKRSAPAAENPDRRPGSGSDRVPRGTAIRDLGRRRRG